jgi:hypothetical protein
MDSCLRRNDTQVKRKTNAQQGGGGSVPLEGILEGESPLEVGRVGQ